MVKFKCWKILTVLFKIILGISASTHWVVTENGKIQSQLDSAYHMRRPYDLLSLLEQEHRAAEIERLYREMVQQKANIDQEWAGLESATELEARLYTSDSDCLKAGKPLSDVDLYISVADDGTSRDGIDFDELMTPDLTSDTLDQPDCSTTFDLQFTMRTFPHLQVLSWNLTSEPEVLELKTLSGQIGKQISAGLRHNSTSWFLHNMAALYWRSQGDAWRALQCAKRAVYLSPREYRDLALLNLGCIVHQARCPAEAAILLHAAVDHAPHVAASHFVLANVYAILGDYNRSVACYDNVLKLQPHWPAAERNRFAVLCHHKIEASLYQLHRSLQGILSQLHDYHNLQEQWLKHQEQLMYQQAPLEVKLQGFQHEPLSALLSHRGGEKCMPHMQDGSHLLRCNNKLLAHHLQIDITLSLQMLLKNVESQAQKISEQMSHRLVNFGGTESPMQVERGEEEANTFDEVGEDLDDGEGNLEIFIETPEVESKDESLPSNPESDSTPSSSFLPYKHPKLQSLKDFGIKFKDSVLGLVEDFLNNQRIDQQMLMPETHCQSSTFTTDGCIENTNQWLLPQIVDDDTRQFNVLPVAQSLGIVEEGSWLQNTSSHVIATLIMTCIQLSQWDVSEVTSSKEEPMCSNESPAVAELSGDSFSHITPEPRLKLLLQSLLLDDNISLTDFTALLSHALKDKTRHSPRSAWMLETAAALYWRFVGNTHQMVACLHAAIHKAPPNLKDIPLHHVAQILLTLGHYHEALVLASLALKVSPGSINAHVVLFHTYVALGEPENAIKYGKASIALYQQLHGRTSP